MASIFDPNNPTAFNLLGNQQQQPFTISQENYQQPSTNANASGMNRNQRIGFMLAALSDAFAGRDVAGRAMGRAQAIRQQAEVDRQRQEALERQQQLNQFITNANIPDSQKALLGNLPFDVQAKVLANQMFGTDKAKPTSYQEYALTDDTPTREEYTQFLQSKRSSVSDPLRTITMGGKVVKNVRDSELTPEFIKEINESGQVVQPLGFTEKFESSKDVDFAPIKSKYLATQNIIIKTSELAEKFATEPSSALAVGKATQFVDGIIKNIDAGGEILSKAKDTKVYKYIQNTSTSLEGKDFTSKIADASKASGVAESRIRDLAYLFAAARGQTGKGLSDKDYENALKIVTGGVGASGRIAVLEDVATGLRDEFYRDIDFDIGTSENEAYVNKLKGLPQLPSFINPFTQVQLQTGGSDPLGIR